MGDGSNAVTAQTVHFYSPFLQSISTSEPSVEFKYPLAMYIAEVSKCVLDSSPVVGEHHPPAVEGVFCRGPQSLTPCGLDPRAKSDRQ